MYAIYARNHNDARADAKNRLEAVRATGQVPALLVNAKKRLRLSLFFPAPISDGAE